MKKSFKNFCIALLAFIGVTALSGGMALAYADEGSASAPSATEKTSLVTDEYFKMVGGAAIRLDENNGIRFIAEIGAEPIEGASYYMLIVPTGYLEHFNIEIADSTNYYVELDTALKAYDAEHEGSHKADTLAVMACEPFKNANAGGTEEGYSGCYVQGSLKNIKFDNSNAGFFGIAFYVTGEEGEEVYTYASSGSQNVRTITELAVYAYSDKTAEYGEDEMAIIKKYMSNGVNKHRKNAEGTAVDFAALTTAQTYNKLISDEDFSVAVDLPSCFSVDYQSNGETVSVGQFGNVTLPDSITTASVNESITVTVLDTTVTHVVNVYDLEQDAEFKAAQTAINEFNEQFVGVSPATVRAQAAKVADIDAKLTALGEFRTSKLQNYQDYLDNKNSFVLFEDYSDVSSAKFVKQGGGFANLSNNMSVEPYGTVGNVGCGQTANVFAYTERNNIDYGTCQYVQFVVINRRHNSNLVVKIIQNDNWNNTLAETASLAYDESALLTVNVADFKKGIIRADFDAASTNGTNYLITAMYAVSASKTTQNVINKINAIGTVSLDSKTAIADARAAYNALTMQQELVTNYSVLTKAEADFKNLARSEYLTESVTALEGKMSDFNVAVKSLSPATVHSLTASVTEINAAYAALSEDEKMIVNGYDEYLANSTSFVIFEDYSTFDGNGTKTIMGNSAGYQGEMSKNDDTYGKCLGLYFNTPQLYALTYQKKANVPSGYKYVSFAVYNNHQGTLTLKIINDANWSVALEVLIDAGAKGEWFEVTISMSNFIGAGNMFRIDYSDAVAGNIWFSAMYAHN